jgi:hypothetical protein
VNSREEQAQRILPQSLFLEFKGIKKDQRILPRSMFLEIQDFGE